MVHRLFFAFFSQGVFVFKFVSLFYDFNVIVTIFTINIIIIVINTTIIITRILYIVFRFGISIIIIVTIVNNIFYLYFGCLAIGHWFLSTCINFLLSFLVSRLGNGFLILLLFSAFEFSFFFFRALCYLNTF